MKLYEPLFEKTKERYPDRKPGEVWQTKSGNFLSKNRSGFVRRFFSPIDAKAFSSTRKHPDFKKIQAKITHRCNNIDSKILKLKKQIKFWENEILYVKNMLLTPYLSDVRIRQMNRDILRIQNHISDIKERISKLKSRKKDLISRLSEI
jgi:DNA polymerase III delta prime subunit